MSSVGDALRRERLQKGLSLEQISRETKISVRLLDAIEREQFDLLPGGVFARSFVRQYARFLGLDEEGFAVEIDKVVSPIVDLPGFDAPPPDPTIKLPNLDDFSYGLRSMVSVLPSLAMMVAVMLLCAGGYVLWQKVRGPATAPPPVAVRKPALPAPAKPAKVTPALQDNPAETARTEVVASTPAAETAPGTANPATALHVSLTAETEVWVQAWADGKSVIVGTLQPNVVKTLDAVDAVRIRTGNAGGLQVTVNGKPAGPIGPNGQVRTVEISRDKIQVLPPPAKPAPASALEPL